jgi:hypothetical protein
MGARDDIAPLLEILLEAIAEESGTTQEYLSLEVEQVALKALLAAYNSGNKSAHERPTIRPRIDTDRQFPAPKGAWRPKKKS